MFVCPSTCAFSPPCVFLSFCTCPHLPVWTSMSISEERKMKSKREHKKDFCKANKLNIKAGEQKKKKQKKKQGALYGSITIYTVINNHHLRFPIIDSPSWGTCAETNFILSTDSRSAFLLEHLIFCRQGGNTILTPDQKGVCPRTEPTSSHTRGYQSMLCHARRHARTFTRVQKHPGPAMCGLWVSTASQVQTTAFPLLLFNMFGAQPLIKDPQSSINLCVSHQPFIYSPLSLRPTQGALTLKWMRWKDGGRLCTRK